MTCHSLLILHVFRVMMDLPDSTEEPHPIVRSVRHQKGSNVQMFSQGKPCAVTTSTPDFWPVPRASSVEKV